MLIEITRREIPDLSTGVTVYRAGCGECTSSIATEWQKSIGNRKSQLEAIFSPLDDSESENENESEDGRSSVFGQQHRVLNWALTGGNEKENENDESAVFEQLHQFFIHTLTEGCQEAMSKLAHDDAHWTALISADEYHRAVNVRKAPPCIVYGSGRALKEHIRYRGVHIHHRSSTKSSVILMTLQSSDTISDDYKLCNDLNDLVKYSWTTKEDSTVDKANRGFEEIERYIAAQEAVEAMNLSKSLGVRSGRGD
jgi:hypothetical protein